MTEFYIEEARKSIYMGESAINCEECGEPIPACKYCLPCGIRVKIKGNRLGRFCPWVWPFLVVFKSGG